MRTLYLNLQTDLKVNLISTYRIMTKQGGDEYSVRNAGIRALKNLCLGLLLYLVPDNKILTFAMQQYSNAKNMTDVMGALMPLVYINNINLTKTKTLALEQFYTKWKNDHLIINEWLKLQASSQRKDTVEVVQQLMQHPGFNINEISKVNSLLGVFKNNIIAFNRVDGAGYKFLAFCIIEIDRFNSSMAAVLAEAFIAWEKLDLKRQDFMITELVGIYALGEEKISKNLLAVVNNGLIKAPFLATIVKINKINPIRALAYLKSRKNCSEGELTQAYKLLDVISAAMLQQYFTINKKTNNEFKSLSLAKKVAEKHQFNDAQIICRTEEHANNDKILAIEDNYVTKSSRCINLRIL